MTGKWKMTLEERFWSKVDVRGTDECWEWKAGINSTGRGIFWFNGKDTHAHRVAWIIAKGKIPAGMQICHRCDNGKCVNPNHLFLGTQLDNMHDMFSKGREKILRGNNDPKHKLTEEQVRFIKTHYKPYDPVYGQFGLSRMFHISRSTVEAVLNGSNWKHIV